MRRNSLIGRSCLLAAENIGMKSLGSLGLKPAILKRLTKGKKQCDFIRKSMMAEAA